MVNLVTYDNGVKFVLAFNNFRSPDMYSRPIKRQVSYYDKTLKATLVLWNYTNTHLKKIKVKNRTLL